MKEEFTIMGEKTNSNGLNLEKKLNVIDSIKEKSPAPIGSV
jgi:hypothetical protein